MTERGEIVVDLRTLKANALKFKRRIGGAELIGVVKADGYGHGAEKIAESVAAFDSFAVATAAEGERLRAVTAKPVFLLGYDEPEKAVENSLIVSVWDKSQIKELSEIAAAKGRSAQVRIAVDTGMNRIGVKGEREFIGLAEEAENGERIDFCGAYTHFPDGENESDSLARLEEFLSVTKSRPTIYKSAAATARAADGRFTLSGVRLGLGAYGYGAEFVKPCLSLYGKVVRVRRLERGEAVGYNSRYRCRKSTYIATLSLGYADGVSRGYTGGEVIINGKKRKIVGNVCMDCCFAEADEKVAAGDRAVFIGEENGLKITAEDVAAAENTICYEILTRLKRVKRRYIY